MGCFWGMLRRGLWNTLHDLCIKILLISQRRKGTFECARVSRNDQRTGTYGIGTHISGLTSYLYKGGAIVDRIIGETDRPIGSELRIPVDFLAGGVECIIHQWKVDPYVVFTKQLNNAKKKKKKKTKQNKVRNEQLTCGWWDVSLYKEVVATVHCEESRLLRRLTKQEKKYPNWCTWTDRFEPGAGLSLHKSNGLESGFHENEGEKQVHSLRRGKIIRTISLLNAWSQIGGACYLDGQRETGFRYLHELEDVEDPFSCREDIICRVACRNKYWRINLMNDPVSFCLVLSVSPHLQDHTEGRKVWHHKEHRNLQPRKFCSRRDIGKPPEKRRYQHWLPSVALLEELRNV